MGLEPAEYIMKFTKQISYRTIAYKHFIVDHPSLPDIEAVMHLIATNKSIRKNIDNSIPLSFKRTCDSVINMNIHELGSDPDQFTLTGSEYETNYRLPILFEGYSPVDVYVTRVPRDENIQWVLTNGVIFRFSPDRRGVFTTVLTPDQQYKWREYHIVKKLSSVYT